MHGLALRLEGPLQSWGGPAIGDNRPTLEFPTKSGVLGLVAALMGIDRLNIVALGELHQRLAVSIRVDRQGTRGMDFHTAQDVPTMERKAQPTVVTRRHYLQDASFVALLHCDGPEPLTGVLAALSSPRFPPYLGRRACVLSEPLLATLAGGKAPGTILHGAGPIGMLAEVESPAPSGSPRWNMLTAMDEAVYLEGNWQDRCPSAWRFVRLITLRDQLYGNLPRLFQERTITHLSRKRAQPAKDTVDPWMPSSH